MSFFVFALALALTTAAAIPASAAPEDDDSEGPFHSLDSVDTGQTHSLDSVDTGQTESLDSVDTGRTESLDSVDTGQTDSLDSVDTGHTESLNSVDTGDTESLDSVVERSYESPAAPASSPLPSVEDGNWEAQAHRAKGLIAAAEKRLKTANAAYGNMMERDHPAGDGRAKIVEERHAAERALNDAWEYYGQIKKRARDAGSPL
jgi:hypothetical protein